jgi:hypothetical protein
MTAGKKREGGPKERNMQVVNLRSKADPVPSRQCRHTQAMGIDIPIEAQSLGNISRSCPVKVYRVVKTTTGKDTLFCETEEQGMFCSIIYKI